jgi:hypothetical protein
MHKHQGITLIGMLLTMAIIIIAGVFTMRVVPVYIQYYEVTNSMQALDKIPATEFSSDPAANGAILRTKLLNQLYVNSIESISPEQIVIEPNGENKFKLSIKYKVIRPLVANVSLLFDFNAYQEVDISA